MRTMGDLIRVRLREREPFTVMLSTTDGNLGEYAVREVHPEVLDLEPVGTNRKVLVALAHIVSAEIIEG